MVEIIEFLLCAIAQHVPHNEWVKMKDKIGQIQDLIQKYKDAKAKETSDGNQGLVDVEDKRES